jgi:hypothetical protein
MPIQNRGSKYEYFLITFDTQGIERAEGDGPFSKIVKQHLGNTTPPITDVFVMSHGWLGDVPGAISQFDKWVTCVADNKPVEIDDVRPGFRSLTIGLHWPSLPWGDETVPATDDVAAGGDNHTIDAQLESYACAISNTPKARTAIRIVLNAAQAGGSLKQLSPAVSQAYDEIFREVQLSVAQSHVPGPDMDELDLNLILSQARKTDAATEGLGDITRDVLLAPLRILSFWKMKERARLFGQSGANALLSGLQQVAPEARYHLVGHSFGCIVAAAAVLGAPNSSQSCSVNTLILLQGALSLWAFASNVPYLPNEKGHFFEVVRHKLVSGPIVSTRSSFDAAVGHFYPLAARLAGQVLEEVRPPPKFGGIGSFGINGLEKLNDLLMKSVTDKYDFQPFAIYNLEASKVIKDGAGIAGAHSDIAHPEVAHALWAAALVNQNNAQP